MPRRRGQDRDDEGFAAPLEPDDAWMDALRDEAGDGAVAPAGADELRRALDGLAARVEALEAEVARLSGRPAPASATLAGVGPRAAEAAARLARRRRPPG